MDLPRGPKESQPPFVPPQAPKPNGAPTPPAPQHPEHTGVPDNTLGPPDNFDERMSSPSAPLRPRILGVLRQAVVGSSEPSREDKEPVETPEHPHPLPALQPPQPAAPRRLEHDAQHEAEPPDIPQTELISPEEPTHIPEAARPAPLTGIVEIKPPENEQPTENPYRQIGTDALKDTIPGYAPLPPHPGRLNDAAELQAAKDAGQPVTEIILVIHSAENAAGVAAALPDCDVLAMEYTLNADERQIQDIKRIVNDMTSSNPSVSVPAWDDIERYGLGPFISTILDSVRNTDTIVELIDITTSDPKSGPLLQAFNEAQNKRAALGKTHQAPSIALAHGFLEEAKSVAAMNSERDPNFAERLDELRLQYPEKNINFVVGATHYAVSQQLDASHVHALVVGSPMEAPDYLDEMIPILQNGQPVPPALLERATLAEIYRSAAYDQGYEKLILPSQLGKGRPDYPTETTGWKDHNYIRSLLIEKMTDTEVHDIIVRLDRTIRLGVRILGWGPTTAMQERLLANMAHKFGGPG